MEFLESLTSIFRGFSRAARVSKSGAGKPVGGSSPLPSAQDSKGLTAIAAGQGADSCCTNVCATDLQLVVDAWAVLSADVRDCILAIVRARRPF
jgi:hypothetical protein